MSHKVCGQSIDGLCPINYHTLILFLSTQSRLTFDQDILLSISSLVTVSFREVDGFNATQAFVVTWENVAPYSESTDEMVSNDQIHCTMTSEYIWEDRSRTLL